MRMIVRTGDKIAPQDMIHQLIAMQYARSELDFRRGTFRVRGDSIDVYPAEMADAALRISMFDDEVDSLTLFDPLTGHTIHTLPRFTVYAKSHYVTPRSTVLNALEGIKTELRDRIQFFSDENKLLEAQRIQQRTTFDLEMLNEIGFCKGIENYSRHMSGRKAGEPPPTLVDYLPKNALMIIDESHVTIPQVGGMYKGDRARKENLVNYGFRLPSAMDNRPLRFDEFEAMMRQTVFVSATPADYEATHTAQVVEQLVRPTGLVDPILIVRPASTQVDDLLSEANKRIVNQERVLVTTLTKRMAEDLTDYLAENGIKVRYLHSDIDTVERVQIIRDLRAGLFDVLVGINLLRGTLHEGIIELAGGQHLTVAVDPNDSGPVTATIHPHSIGLHRSRPAGSARNIWETVVEDVDDEGQRFRVRVGAPVALTIEISAAAQFELAIEPGAPVWISFKATEVAVQPD